MYALPRNTQKRSRESTVEDQMKPTRGNPGPSSTASHLRKKGKKGEREHADIRNRSVARLAGVVEVDNKTDRTGLRLDSLGVVALVLLGVGIEKAEQTLADSGALRALVITDTHALDVQGGQLSNDARHIPAGVAVVLLVAHIELTPGGGILANVGGRDLTGSSGPTTLGVVVNGHILGLTLADVEGESLVGLPETVHLAIGAIGVPEDHGPLLVGATVETHDVLVLVGLALLDLDDVATPGATNVALVAPVLLARVGAVGARSKAFQGVIAAGGGFIPRATGGAAGGDGADGGLDTAGGRVGFDAGGRGLSRGGSRGFGGGGGGGSGGGGSSGRRGLSADLARPVVDPGLEDTIDGAAHDIADGATLHLDLKLGGLGSGGALHFEFDLGETLVFMATLVTVKTSDRRASGQRRHQEHGVLELHDEILQKERKDLKE